VEDKIYPTSGLSARLTWQYGIASAPAVGFESTYGRAVFDTKGYLAISDAGTLALRGTLCSASSGSPFYNLCVIGATDGMRGFAFGEALGGGLASVQGEYRHRLGTRLGVTAFAGGGQVASRLDVLADGTSHFAGGLGVRYRVSKRFPVDFSLDWAINDAGYSATYIYIRPEAIPTVIENEAWATNLDPHRTRPTVILNDRWYECFVRAYQNNFSAE
jgi:hemolysin activation/secretion protein